MLRKVGLVRHVLVGLAGLEKCSLSSLQMCPLIFMPQTATLFSEDPLLYLPRTPIQHLRKRRIIYDAQQPPEYLYAIIAGRVMTTRVSMGGDEIVTRIVTVDGLFGESILVDDQLGTEMATALDDVSLMSWSAAVIKAQIECKPRLGWALFQCFVREGIALQHRIQDMVLYQNPERIRLALLQLADGMGTPTADGWTRLGALTHQTLAGYVGTSREVMTTQLNRLRRLGVLRYSRQHIDLYVPAIRNLLQEQGVRFRPFQTSPMHAAP
jgi:CRP/FNR family transcriptional regulator, cyclic AMP receptor protein